MTEADSREVYNLESRPTTTCKAPTSITSAEIHDAVPIDPDGDLIVLCGTQAFVVDKHVVKRTSRKLADRIVNGVNNAAVNRPDKIILQMNEDSETMKVLLNIMHLNFRAVPTNLSLETLARLTTFCKSHDILHLLKPFQEVWIRRHDICVGEADLGNPKIAALATITWTLGLHTIFQRIVLDRIQQAAIESRRRDLSNCLKRYICGTEPSEWSELPVGVLETLCQAYDDSVHRLLSGFLDAYNYMLGDAFECRSATDIAQRVTSPHAWNFRDNQDRADSTRRTCRAALLKSYGQYLPLLRESNGIEVDVNRKAVVLTRDLRMIDIIMCHQNAKTEIMTALGHDDCSVGLLLSDSALQIINDLPQTIRLLHREWLENQGQVSSVESTL